MMGGGHWSSTGHVLCVSPPIQGTEGLKGPSQCSQTEDSMPHRGH